MITKEQYESIRINIKNRGIESIDLEVEMLDHISSAVEEKMNSGQSFRNAFKDVMLGFGPNGMYELQREKYDYLLKKGLKQIAIKYLELFRPPQVIATVISFLSLYFIFLNNESKIVFQLFSYGAFLIFLITLVTLKIKNYKMQFSQIKAYDQILGLSYIIVVPFFNTMFFDYPILNPTEKTLIVLIPSIFYYSYLYVVNKMYKELSHNYKEYIYAS